MKLILRGGLLVVLGLTLSACGGITKHQRNYLKYSKSIPPVTIPKTDRVKFARAYYPIPTVRGSGSTNPSLIPPGSKIEQYRAQIAAKKHRRKAS